MPTKVLETNKAAPCLNQRWTAMSLVERRRITGDGTISLAAPDRSLLNNCSQMQLRNRRLRTRRVASARRLAALVDASMNNNQSISNRKLDSNPAANLAIPNYKFWNNKESLCCLLLPLMLIVAHTFAGRSIVPTVECSQTSTTYAEPISWSFGGWAPVDGMPQKHSANHSSSVRHSASTPSMPKMAHNESPINPLKPQQRAHHQLVSAGRMPPPKPGPIDQHFFQMRASGSDSSYSPRAPMPIMREHLLSPPVDWPMPRVPNDGHRKQMMQSYARPQHVPGPSYFQNQHNRHMSQHQQRIEQIHGRIPQQFRPQEAPKMFAPYQFRPLQQTPVQHHRPMQLDLQSQQHSNSGNKYRQEPILYMNQHQLSSQGDRIPVLEVSAHHNSTGSQPQAKRLVAPVQLPEPPMANSDAAIERDINYQTVLRKVESGEIGLPANSIHDIKQQQEKLERELNKNSYLTIPVAVETDGDRVLTADDISEIEKHVINVLPNLKTADKITKIAEAQVASAVNESSPYVHLSPMVQVVDPPAPTTTRYIQHEPQQTTVLQRVPVEETHYSTVKNEPPHHSSSPSVPSSSYSDETSSSAGPSLTELTHYLVVSEPAQEIGVLGDLSDMNLNNDLLHQFRYEPTRANPSGKHQQANEQRASTPPMSQSAYSFRPRNRQPSQGRQLHQQRSPSATTTRSGHKDSLASTKTIMGGQKVSDVMRLLIRTTPVPLTSPMHVPSLEPERVDAIQLIAGGPHEHKPMVVEAHELVNHTPDGGIDYNSGRTSPSTFNGGNSQPEQQQQQQQYQSANQSSPNQYEIQIAAPPQNTPEHPSTQLDQGNHQQGAIIEYVSLSEPQTLDQAYEVSGRPEVYMEHSGVEQANINNNIKQLAYKAPLSLNPESQHYQTTSTSAQPPADSNLAHAAWSPSIANEHQQHLELLSEHANRQLDLPATAGYNFFTNHADPQARYHQQPQPQPQEQQLDNQEQQVPVQYLDQDQQQQHQEEQQSTTKSSPHHKDSWRTKAGGRQPNPDAQYDGQIAKASSKDQEQEPEQEQPHDTQNNSHQQAHTGFSQPEKPVELLPQTTTSDMNHGHHTSSLAASLGQNSSTANNGHTLSDVYQQVEYGSASSPSAGQQQQQLEEGDEEEGRRIQHSTSSLVAGSQLNHATPSQDQLQSYAGFEQVKQHLDTVDGSSAGGTNTGSGPEYGYIKLDRNKHQGHLRRQQAQHQAQRAQMLQQPQPQAQQAVQSHQSHQSAGNELLEPAPNKSLSNEYSRVAEQQTILGSDEGLSGSREEESEPSVGDKELTGYQDSTSLLDGPTHYEQQASLLADSNHDTNHLFSDDDKAKQLHPVNQKEPVYQVYQAYYAPKHHKPLPGYVRLSIREFNELFRDAEIKYVGGAKNGTSAAAPGSGAHL